MDLEWDSAKEQANRKKHGIDFRTAARVFLDPFAIEFDDLDVSMTAHCTLHCNPTAFATRHRLEEYWYYVAAALPASVDKTKLPPAPAKPSLAP